MFLNSAQYRNPSFPFSKDYVFRKYNYCVSIQLECERNHRSMLMIVIVWNQYFKNYNIGHALLLTPTPHALHYNKVFPFLLIYRIFLPPYKVVPSFLIKYLPHPQYRMLFTPAEHQHLLICWETYW